MTTVYCGSCGAALSETAKFCRACGSSQTAFSTPTAEVEPASPSPLAPTPKQQLPVRHSPPAKQPPPPASPAAALPPLTAPPPPPHGLAPPSPRTGGIVALAAILALVGGAGMCLVVLYAVVYWPLQHSFPVNFGEPVEFGDVLAIASGLLAAVLGGVALRRPPANPLGAALVLLLAGLPTLVLAVVWAYPETFHLDVYTHPFYFGYSYFAQLGQVHYGDHYLQLSLLLAAAAVTLAGTAMLGAPRCPAAAPSWR